MLSITRKITLIFLSPNPPKPRQGAGLTEGANFANHPTNRLENVEIFSKVLDFVRFCQVIVDNFLTPIHQSSPRLFSYPLRKLLGHVDILMLLIRPTL